MEKHFQKCLFCDNDYYMRDLGQVIHHNTGKCEFTDVVKDVPYNSSRKMGDSVEWTKDKKMINLN